MTMAKQATKTEAPKRLRVTQIRSGIGFDKKQSLGAQGAWGSGGFGTPWRWSTRPPRAG